MSLRACIRMRKQSEMSVINKSNLRASLNHFGGTDRDILLSKSKLSRQITHYPRLTSPLQRGVTVKKITLYRMLQLTLDLRLWV